MRSDRPTFVPHASRWAKRALSVAFLALVLGTLAVPVPKRAPTGSGAPVKLPPGVSRPLDGVGDSPAMPE